MRERKRQRTRDKVPRADADVCLCNDVAALDLREHLSTSAAERRAFSRAMKMSRSSAMVSATMDGEEEQRPHDGAAFVE